MVRTASWRWRLQDRFRGVGVAASSGVDGWVGWWSVSVSATLGASQKYRRYEFVPFQLATRERCLKLLASLTLGLVFGKMAYRKVLEA